MLALGVVDRLFLLLVLYERTAVDDLRHAAVMVILATDCMCNSFVFDPDFAYERAQIHERKKSELKLKK